MAAGTEMVVGTKRDAKLRGRVLIVDDEQMIGRTLRRALSAHEVVTVDSGGAAREMLLSDRAFDVVICDLVMPEVTGMDLHAWAMEIVPEMARKMIFMTGGTFTQRAREFLASEEVVYLDKPFDLTRLRTLVAARISATKRRSTMPPPR